MRQLFADLERVAELDATLLFEGASGTGKDLAAEAVHGLSARRDQAFITVDCGSMQDTMAGSELFGHSKGAFTDAKRERMGAFEEASGGTLFLDEIGELDLSLQPKLLHVLERHEVKRLGENKYRPVNVRLIAATNRDLDKEMAAGRFREDLYYRLSVVRMRMPALSERREDIALLARSFVQKLRPDLDPSEVLSDQVLGLLSEYHWPGNVRELRNVVERLLLFPEQAEAMISGAKNTAPKGEESLQNLPFHEAKNLCNDRFERAYLSAALDATEHVVAKAAARAQVPRQTFYRLMRKHQLVKA